MYLLEQFTIRSTQITFSNSFLKNKVLCMVSKFTLHWPEVSGMAAHDFVWKIVENSCNHL